MSEKKVRNSEATLRMELGFKREYEELLRIPLIRAFKGFDTREELKKLSLGTLKNKELILVHCPIGDHNVKSMLLDLEKDTFSCHLCGKHGDVVQFWAACWKQSIMEALVFLREHFLTETEKTYERVVRKD